MSVPEKVRIDKWLWSIRLYKTRTAASAACRAGRVKIDGRSVKPAHAIEPGTVAEIRKRDRTWVVKALKLIEKRVGAAIAETCYEDLSLPQEPSEKLPHFFYRSGEKRDRGSGRPTKKDRRAIDRLKDGEE